MISTVYIAKNVYGGNGLGRLGDGRVVFVPGTWAGEQVRAEIVEEKKHFVKARLVEVVEASPDRLDPAASPEKEIPGMVYAGLSYEGELRTKEQQLLEFFERARIEIPQAPAASPSAKRPAPYCQSPASPLNYRNKVVYHIGQSKGAWLIGYRMEPSHEILDITEDPLARPEINRELPAIRRAVMTLLTTGPVNIRRETAAKGRLTVRWTKATGVKWWLGDAPKDLVLKETTAGLDFEVPAGGFYQVNPEVGDELVKAVVDEVAASGTSRILDLYCGVGVFGLCALRRTAAAGTEKFLTGIESGREAIQFAKKNAESILRSVKTGQTSFDRNVRFFAEEVGRNLRRIPVGAESTVVVDPPRDGLEKGVARWLAGSKAPRIVYVSCDPATLMRDLRELCLGRDGAPAPYRVEKLRWFNMFPRTARFETMVVLERI